MNRFGILKCAALAALLAAPVCVRAADAGPDVAGAKQIVAKWGDAVVKVQVVVKTSMSFDGETSKHEDKSDALGTVIDPTGLTVVSLTAMNPSDMMSGMLGDESDAPKVNSEVSEVKIRLSDGTEVPGKVVLRDKDLDLAFIRPSEKQTTAWTFVDLKHSASVELLDPVVAISRLGKAANRSICVGLGRVQSVIEKPRRFYVVGPMDMFGDVGGPVATADGRAVGLLLMRIAPESGKSRSFSDGPLPVVLPAEDISQVAAQAPEDAPKVAAAESTKPEVKPVKLMTPKPVTPPRATPGKPKPK